ncbi:PREDICTED: conserved oligomeric Golgi complex subunit 5 [Nicrophorus vespilloides]|uniref:Conserved oligomeric Golgi complex subunit 5 n=1 Tax=Nicrophorus vespilloides TaxID=110193 RepID=A0ABM1MXW6_NICVS|nr:PREDICTED: conserved oligomeric Golgi complex subunit 5 [Nicrophorus vespilloides]
MSEEIDILRAIEQDDFYKPFLHSAAKSSLNKSLSITEQVTKLGEGIELLTKELQKQVLEKHDDLLKQANHATKLENVLNTMNNHVENLFANAERLKTQIAGPYEALESHTKVLSRLHLASHILRQVSRIQQLSKRLSNTSDPVRKATILQELEQLASDSDLVDVDAATLALRNVRSEQQKVVKLANSLLTQGVINENSAQTSTALQIFSNLGTLKSAIENVVSIAAEECRESLKTTFDARVNVDSLANKKAGPGRANLTSSQGFRIRIWADLEKAFSEEIYQQCKQIKFLQISLTSMHYDMPDVALNFWNSLGDIITSEIKNGSASVQQMLEEDYPKLLKCYYDMMQKLNYDKFNYSRSILEKCENAYLTNSWTRLLEPTQSMFVQENAAPSHDQIDSLIRNITSEISVALVEETLVEKIAKNVTKCIKLYAVKTEQLLATGPDASQVIGGAPNGGQQLNVQLGNAMYYLQIQIQRMLINMKESLTQTSIGIINDSLLVLDNLTVAILQPLIASINSTIETILVTIHLETDWNKLQSTNRTNIPCSPYMRELIQFISRVFPTYLARFDNKEILSTKCSDIALRCIELLVRHASILRPISQGGRARLQSDFNHLEQSLKLLCPYLTDLGRPYRLFKSMATLVALTPQEIVASQEDGSSVPHSTVLLLLFSFASLDLASPHQNTGWSLPKLSAWLDEHTSEDERLDLIAGALQKYESTIRMKNLTNFDSVYPIMSEFLAQAVKKN